MVTVQGEGGGVGESNRARVDDPRFMSMRQGPLPLAGGAHWFGIGNPSTPVNGYQP